MADYDTIVVGAGIFGSLITKALRAQDQNVLTVDARRAESGSWPAACLMRPGWFTGLGKEVYEPALKILNELVGVQDITFKTAVGSTTVHWCDPVKVMLSPGAATDAVLTGFAPGDHNWVVRFSDYGTATAKWLIIAAGIWTKILLPEIAVEPMGGVAWLWPEGSIKEPFIKVWAPYKQIVAFNRGDGLWAGDGLAIKNWSAVYESKSLGRCMEALQRREASLPIVPTRLFGYRPYVKDAKPCLLKQVRKNLWVATGGAKNGTLAAGWCADQLVRAIA